MALLWRRENAKTLHILDRDGLYKGTLNNLEAIQRAVESIEIPVQLVSRFADVEECEMWLRSGIYRIFIHDLVITDALGVRKLIERYGQSRIGLALIAEEGMVASMWRPMDSIDTTHFAKHAQAIGIHRVFYTDRKYEGILRGPNFDELRQLAIDTGMQITAAGGIGTVEHLWMLQEMEELGIDSVVIGRAFYENCFPCQQLWRDIEAERIQVWSDRVSTSHLTGHLPSDQ